MIVRLYNRYRFRPQNQEAYPYEQPHARELSEGCGMNFIRDLFNILKKALPMQGGLLLVVLCLGSGNLGADGNGAMPGPFSPDRNWSRVIQSLEGKSGQVREKLIWGFLDGEDASLAKAAARQLLEDDPILLALFEGQGSISPANRRRAIHAYASLGAMALETLQDKLAAPGQERFQLDSNEPLVEEEDIWRLAWKDGRYRFYIRSKKEREICLGSELLIRDGDEWLDINGGSGLVLRSRSAYHCYDTSEGGNLGLWPRREGGYFIFAVPMTQDMKLGHLFSLEIGADGGIATEIGRFHAPAVHLGGSFLHAKVGTTDAWLFDPLTRTSRLFMKGPGVEKYHGDDGADYLGYSARADLEQGAGHVTFWGLVIQDLDQVPRMATDSKRIPGEDERLAALAAVAPIWEGQYGGERALRQSQAGDWKPEVLNDGSVRWIVDYKIQDNGEGGITLGIKLIAQGRYFPSQKIFLPDQLSVAMTAADGTTRRWSKAKGVYGGLQEE
jgi:hypothetical protein